LQRNEEKLRSATKLTTELNHSLTENSNESQKMAIELAKCKEEMKNLYDDVSLIAA